MVEKTAAAPQHQKSEQNFIEVLILLHRRDRQSTRGWSEGVGKGEIVCVFWGGGRMGWDYI